MTYNFPFYPHFPTKSYRSYPQSVNSSNISTDYGHYYRKSTINNKNKNGNFIGNTARIQTNNSNFNRISQNTPPTASRENKDKNNKVDEENFFEILGIKLYSDDILLLCLIFFLYREGVQDEYLFIALIMLLLS